MSFVLLIVTICAAWVVQIALGYDFAVSHLMNRIPLAWRTVIQLATVLAIASLGWLIGTSPAGHLRAAGFIAAAGVVGFIMSQYWYLKFPTPPRRPFRGRSTSISKAPFPTPAHLIRFETPIGRKQSDLFDELA